jgi:hypothetical protein
MLCHWHRMHIKIFEQLQKAKRHCYAKNLKINERFVRPWQALKGISIKNIYIRQLSYPTLQKYIYLKGLSNKKFSCMLCHWHRKHESRRLKIRISSRIYEAEFKKTLTRESGAQKNPRPNILWHCPFKFSLGSIVCVSSLLHFWWKLSLRCSTSTDVPSP